MKTVIQIITCAAASVSFTCMGHNLYAQKIGQVVKQSSEQAAKSKIYQVTNEATDKALDQAGTELAKDVKGLFKKKKKEKNKTDTLPGNSNTSVQAEKADDEGSGNSPVQASAEDFKTYSKFDFVPGDKVIVAEDFSGDEVGDFPGKWNTNSSGEVVTVNNDNTHWLMISKVGVFVPEYIKMLPDNFTLQFDLMVNPDFHPYSNPLRMYLMDGDNGKKDFANTYLYHMGRSGVLIALLPTDASANSTKGFVELKNFDNGKQVMNNRMDATGFVAKGGKNMVKVSIWRQKQRLRLYLNEDKIIDAPRTFVEGKNYQNLAFQIEFPLKENDRYLISNIGWQQDCRTPGTS